MASLTCANSLTVAAAAAPVKAVSAQKSAVRASIPALSNFSGLKATRTSAVYCQKKTVEEEFAEISAGFRSANGAKGGALSSECSLASEIFAVVPVISGLVLTGVALGFVLLRVEAAVEESQE